MKASHRPLGGRVACRGTAGILAARFSFLSVLLEDVAKCQKGTCRLQSVLILNIISRLQHESRYWKSMDGYFSFDALHWGKNYTLPLFSSNYFGLASHQLPSSFEMYISNSSVMVLLRLCAGLITLRHVWCSVCFTPLSGGAGNRLLCCLDASSVAVCNKNEFLLCVYATIVKYVMRWACMFRRAAPWLAWLWSLTLSTVGPHPGQRSSELQFWPRCLRPGNKT